ncbi:MAG: lysine transporter LysE [Ponticaulis sp.]|nr:lysine transporter LysE [Ponticaulis sp.]
MLYIALLSAQHGRKAGYAVATGVALGLFIVGVLAMLGFSTFVAENRVLYETLRWSGVAYLLYLAWDTLQDANRPLETLPQNELLRESFTRGLVTNLLNPKAFLFYMAVLPSFISVEPNYTGQFFLLTLIYVGVATAIHLAIVLMSGVVSGLLQHPQRRRVIGWVFAVLLVLVAIWVAMKTAQ